MSKELFEIITTRMPDCQIDWRMIEGDVMGPFAAKMKNTAQESEFHGEGDVWTHTQMVCEELIKMPEYRELTGRQQMILFLAALLHDVGKPSCSVLEDGGWHAPKHALAGAKIARDYLWREFGLCGTSDQQSFREAVCLLIRYHSTPPHTLDYPDSVLRLRKIAANNLLVPDFSLRMLHLLSLADMRGRICFDLPEVTKKVLLSVEAAKEAGCFDVAYRFPSAHTQYAYFSGKKIDPDSELYDESWGEVILMAGLPGTGKDAYIKAHFPDLPMVSLDDIRQEKRIPPVGDQGKVVSVALDRSKAFLRKQQPFVWNATSLTPQLRQKEIRLFESYGARVRIIYLETPWEENLSRNRSRDTFVPEEKIEKMLSELIPPECFESQTTEWNCI